MYPSKRHCNVNEFNVLIFQCRPMLQTTTSAAPFVLDLIILAMHVWFLVRVALLNRVGDARIQTSNWFGTGRLGFRSNGKGAIAEPHLIVRVVRVCQLSNWLGFIGHDLIGISRLIDLVIHCTAYVRPKPLVFVLVVVHKTIKIVVGGLFATKCRTKHL